MNESVEPQASNDTAKPVEVLDKRIAVLERKAAREKKARNLAEIQLEQYSLQIYETNQSLENALTSSTQKQAELEYLGAASSDVASELPLSEMISNVVELTGKFCSAGYGFYIVTANGKLVGGKSDEVWSMEDGWQSKNVLEQIGDIPLPLNEPVLLESWVVSAIEVETLENIEQFSSVFYTNFALAGEKIGWMVFLSQHQPISTEILSALATAREHLLSGIRRRLADVRILKRNVQLQDSLNKLEKARKQLIQSEKMASLGQLAAGVAHEINNPVAFIRSNMEVLQQYMNDYKILHVSLQKKLNEDGCITADFYQLRCSEVDLPYIDEDSADLLLSNIDGLDRVKEIVENLKSFSHSGDEELSQISIYSCVEAALKVANNVFKYEHQIENTLVSTCPLIMGNLGQLQQVFINLFVNAAYAMEGGGTLSISSSVQDRSLVVHVKDTGCGMDEKTVNQLFTPFFTTKPVGVGTGLGLSVSYAILEAHRAEVVVDSELGKGTIFNLSFPITS